MSDKKEFVSDTNRAGHMRTLAGLETHTQIDLCGAVSAGGCSERAFCLARSVIDITIPYK
jgi:hypothetical protein